MKSISIALATYNGHDFIGTQLESLANQTYLPAELVVTDDASADDTVELVENFAATAPFPVHLHRNPERLGYRGNFMKALSLCRSDLVALCDQDDVWDPAKLMTAATAFETPDTLLFFHQSWLIDATGARLGAADIFRLPPSSPPLSAHSLGNPFGFSMVVDRSLAQFGDLWEQSIDSSDPQSRMAHDQWLFFLAAILGVIIYSDEFLVSYRQHGGNTYGFAKTTGLTDRLRTVLNRLTHHSADYGQMALVVRVRAAILKDMQLGVRAPPLDPVWRQRAAAGEQACLRLAHRVALRARLYSDASFSVRARALAQLVSDGAYATDHGFGVGVKSGVKDFLFGLLLRRFLVIKFVTDKNEATRIDVR